MAFWGEALGGEEGLYKEGEKEIWYKRRRKWNPQWLIAQMFSSVSLLCIISLSQCCPCTVLPIAAYVLTPAWLQVQVVELPPKEPAFLASSKFCVWHEAKACTLAQ